MKPSNTPPPNVTAVQITDERLTFDLEDGRGENNSWRDWRVSR